MQEQPEIEPETAASDVAAPGKAGSVTVPLLLLLTVAIMAFGAILFATGRHFDAQEAARTEQRVQRSLDGALAALGVVIRDYAGWDAALMHLVDELDLPWADENVGLYMTGAYRVAVTLVVDRQGTITYAVMDGKRLPAGRLADMQVSPAIRHLVSMAEASPPGIPQPATGIIAMTNGVFLAAAADIRPSMGAAPRSDGAVLLFMQQLDRVATARMLDALLLDDVDIRTDANDTHDSRFSAKPLTLVGADAGADPVAWITWRTPAPVQDFLAGIYWLLGLVVLVLFALTVQILLRVQRTQARVETAGQELRHAYERQRGLLDSLPDLVCLLRDGRITLVNKAGLVMLGLPVTDGGTRLVGRPFLDLVADHDRLSFQRRMQSGGRVARLEWSPLRLVGPDGLGVPVELALLPLAGEGGGELTVVARDQRAELASRESLRAAQARADIADRAKGQFLANISHELRTPLNAIIGFSEILRDELLGGLGVPQYREYAVDIHEGGLHLLRLVNDLLDIARMDAGELDLRESWVDMSVLVERCERLLRQKAAERGVPLRTDVAPVGLRVLADEVRVKQMLVNLIGNAIRFSDRGEQVTLTTRLEAGSGDLLIEVADHGIGMNVEAMRIALEPFAQVEGGHNRRQPGAGLGLPLAKGYAEAHGGTLSLRSTPAIGTTVTVRFPASRVGGPLIRHASG